MIQIILINDSNQLLGMKKSVYQSLTTFILTKVQSFLPLLKKKKKSNSFLTLKRLFFLQMLEKIQQLTGEFCLQ